MLFFLKNVIVKWVHNMKPTFRQKKKVNVKWGHNMKFQGKKQC